jgi:anti-sigma B factor antagonist
MNSCRRDVEVLTDLLSLTSSRDDHSATIAVQGELDLATAPLLERALAELIADRSCRSIVLDLHDLDFVGSAGLTVLINAQAHTRTAGGDITLARPSTATMRALQITGLVSTFTIRDDTDAGAEDHAAPEDRAPSP